MSEQDLNIAEQRPSAERSPEVVDQGDRDPVLVSIGGLPGTGKTTIARRLAIELRAAYVRVDSIEAAIGRAEGHFERTNGWEQPPGYLVGYGVAVDQLLNGLDVVAESVNPLRTNRDAWRDAGLATGARVVDVEVVCSDGEEHRRRAEERIIDVAGLTRPSWEQIVDRKYDPWDRDRVVVDTATLAVEESVHLVRRAVRGQESTGAKSSTGSPS